MCFPAFACSQHYIGQVVWKMDKWMNKPSQKKQKHLNILCRIRLHVTIFFAYPLILNHSSSPYYLYYYCCCYYCLNTAEMKLDQFNIKSLLFSIFVTFFQNHCKHENILQHSRGQMREVFIMWSSVHQHWTGSAPLTHHKERMTRQKKAAVIQHFSPPQSSTVTLPIASGQGKNS